MIKNINALLAVSAEDENGDFKPFLVDFFNQLVFDIQGNQVEQDIKEQVMSAILNQQNNLKPNIPYEKISEVMKTEKKLADENTKHIFRRR